MNQDPVEDVNGAMQKSAPAAAGLMLLLLLVFIVLAAVYAMLAAAFAAPLLIGLTQCFAPRQQIDLRRAYVAATQAGFAFIAVTIALMYLLPDRLTSPLVPWVTEFLRQSPPPGGFPVLPASERWRAAAMIAVPGLLAYGFILSKQLQGVYAGMAGFLRAMAVGLPMLAGSFSMAHWITLTFIERIQSRQIDGADAFSALFYFAVLTFVCAIAAAIIGAMTLVAIARWVQGHERPRWSDVVGVVFVGMLLHMGITEAVIFLLPDSHPLLAYARLLASSASLVTLGDALAAADGYRLFLAACTVQIPGLLVFGAVLASKLGKVYRGLSGYALACSVSVSMLASGAAGIWALSAVSQAMWPYIEASIRQ